MIIFDTDIYPIAQHPDSPEAMTLHSHVIQLPKDVEVGTTIVSYDEQTRGWFKFFARAKSRPEQLNAYFKLFKHLKDWQGAHVIPFDEAAADVLDHLRTLRLRVGTNDLRIAAIALSRDATLITRNLLDFERIPGLRLEDWTKA